MLQEGISDLLSLHSGMEENSQGTSLPLPEVVGKSFAERSVMVVGIWTISGQIAEVAVSAI
jgi:hypothetical protein